MWKRRVVNKHHQYSCCGQKHVFTYVVGGRVGMNETCYFTFDMKKLVPTPPHPIPCDHVCPKCRISHAWKCKGTSSSPPHPTPSHVIMCAQSVESHMCANAKERHRPHPTPSHVMCAQSVESHMCASAKERHQSLFLINIHPLLPPPPTAEKSLCFLM